MALAVFWRALAVLQCIVYGILEEVLAVNWRGACSVLEGCGILETPLVVVWRSVAFLEGTCSVLEMQEAFVQGHGGHGRVQYFTCDLLSSVAIVKYKI